eukprot:TRINITY_DN90700_c0_g1_i1.p2 TRINITY_DN90700_c0_g1~~TRINITY_DN90700_c0_g1_i1.p2  ORF type:complete len:177 (+),score=45.21 TRINITY_DN90700_c0_g1_i1:40-531(+)
MAPKRSSPPSLDFGRGALNFGDESLYLAVLEQYSQQLLTSVQRVEEASSSGDRGRLREEVLLLQSSASYIAADRLKAAAAALLQALETRKGNDLALISSLCDQARALCVEVRAIVAAGGPKGGSGGGMGSSLKGLEADELTPVLEGAARAETQPRKCSGCTVQ